MLVMSVVILVESFKVDVIINIGLVGVVVIGLNVGDVVVVDILVYYDVDLIVFGYDYG